MKTVGDCWPPTARCVSRTTVYSPLWPVETRDQAVVAADDDESRVVVIGFESFDENALRRSRRLKGRGLRLRMTCASRTSCSAQDDSEGKRDENFFSCCTLDVFQDFKSASGRRAHDAARDA